MQDILFDICLKNDIPINLTEIAITKFTESLWRYDYSKAKKYFIKIFKILDNEENTSSVNAIKIFIKLIKEIDFVSSHYDEQGSNE